MSHKYPTQSELKDELKQLIELKDFIGIHKWLCHPNSDHCFTDCRREVKKDRLAVYGEVCDASPP